VSSVMSKKPSATTERVGHRANGFYERNSPNWYDRSLQHGLENIANPVNLSFGLLRSPPLNRQHIPFHLQKGASLEAAIVAEKVVKDMNLVRDARLQLASRDQELKMSASTGSSNWIDSTQCCSIDNGMAQWSTSLASYGYSNKTDHSTTIPATGQCQCNALKLLGACETCGSRQACRLPIDTPSDDEIDRAYELIKLRRGNMSVGSTPVFLSRRKTSAERLTHAGVPRHVVFGKFSPAK
jgi:hypothetical protein